MIKHGVIIRALLYFLPHRVGTTLDAVLLHIPVLVVDVLLVLRRGSCCGEVIVVVMEVVVVVVVRTGNHGPLLPRRDESAAGNKDTN